MRAEQAVASRRATVREAARGWQTAGAIDAAALARIERAWADTRVRVGPVFRILLFGFTVLATGAAYVLILLVLSMPVGDGKAGVAAIFATILVLLTEQQMGPMRRSGGGTEAATSFCALIFLIMTSVWLVTGGSATWDSAVDAFFPIGAVLFMAAAWRWGYPAYAAAGAAALFLTVVREPLWRWLWIGLALLASPVLASLAESRRLAPPHRTGAWWALIVVLGTLYLSVHIGALDNKVLDNLSPYAPPDQPTAPQRLLSIAATALLPLAIIVWGLRTRRLHLVGVGFLLGVASLVTIRAYYQVAPLWSILVAAGAAAILVALALRRYLDSGQNRERDGITAEPLYEQGRGISAVEMAAAMAAFTPTAHAAAPTETKFHGGGGRSGGGGASGDF